jgi:hypothetical protein
MMHGIPHDRTHTHARAHTHTHTHALVHTHALSLRVHTAFIPNVQWYFIVLVLPPQPLHSCRTKLDWPHIHPSPYLRVVYTGRVDRTPQGCVLWPHGSDRISCRERSRHNRDRRGMWHRRHIHTHTRSRTLACTCCGSDRSTSQLDAGCMSTSDQPTRPTVLQCSVLCSTS